MTGIIPTVGAGGVPLPNANVTNGFIPTTLGGSCSFLFLPNDCTARITAAQINAFESEMLCLAEQLNPGGTWNCGSVCNLSSLFLQWMEGSYQNSLLDKIQDHLCARPVVTDLGPLPSPKYIMCDGAGNIVQYDDIAAGGACCPTSIVYDPVTGLLTLSLSVGGPLTTNVVLPTLTDLNPGGHQIAEYDRNGVLTPINETVTTITNDGLGTITYTDENGNDTIIILNVISVTPPIAGHLIASVFDENGLQYDINETMTTLVVVGDDLVYTDENGTANIIPLPPDCCLNGASFNNGTRDLTLTTTDGGIFVVNIPDAAGGVPAITNTLPPGNRIATFDDGNGGPLIDINETITSLTQAGNVLTYTDEDGAANLIPLPFVTVNSTVAGHLIANVVNETGVVFPINEVITTITNTNAGNQIADYTNEAGAVVPINETITTVTGALAVGRVIGTYNNEAGAAVILRETITTLTVVGDDIIYTDEDGVVNVVPLPTDCCLNGATFNNGTRDLTLTTTDGGIFVVNIPPGGGGGTPSITATVPGHLIGVFDDGNGGPLVNINETVTTITNTNAGNQIADYTNENGVVVPINETITTLSLLGNTLTYNSESGVPTVIPLPVVTVSAPVAGHLIANVTNEAGTVFPINEVITTITGTSPGNQIATYNNENGVAVDINETITTVTGVQAAGKIIGIYTNEAGAVVNIRETSTTISNTNVGNQIADYTNENGTVVSINETITSITGELVVGHIIGTYNRENGLTDVLRETVTDLSLNVNGDLVYVDEAGVSNIIDLPDCCMDSNALTWNVAGQQFRSVVVEGGVSFTSNLTPPVNTQCVIPNRVLGTDAVGNLEFFAQEALQYYGVVERNGSNNVFPAAPLSLTAAAGTVYTSVAVTVTLTNPSPCRSMDFHITKNLELNRDLRGNGNISVEFQDRVQPAILFSTDQNIGYLAAGKGAAVRDSYQDTIGVKTSIVTVAAGASITFDARVRITINAPYQAGSVIGGASVGVQVIGVLN